MPAAPSENRVRLISQGYNTWKVQILFPDAQISAAEISNRLREVKAELAFHFGLSDQLLEYTKLLGKQETREGLLVQILITKQPVPGGAPRFRALPTHGEDGTVVSDMTLEADFFPYDEFEHRLTRQSIEARLRQEGFDLECIDWQVIQTALERAEETLAPVKGVTIGRGVPPHSGQSSRITYGIGSGNEADITSAWMGVRPVTRGEFLLESSAATSGQGFGRNIYGRELEPRRGIQTVLAAGKGTRLVTRGAQLIADRDGLLLFKRAGRDKRDRDAYDMTPAKIIAQVVEAESFREALRFDLDLFEPAMIVADIDADSRIVSETSLFVDGNVGPGAVIECAGTLRVTGNVHGAVIKSGQHACIHGNVSDSDIQAELTLQIQGRVTDSNLRATDVIAGETERGSVEALHRTSIDRIVEAGGAATAIRVNLHRFLEQQQTAGCAALEELTVSLQQILAVFGPEIAFNVTDGTAQRMLLKWLRQQKAAEAVAFTHAEVQEFRAILEMIPLIRSQLQAIGMELRDVTARLENTPPAAPAVPAAVNRTEEAGT